MNGQTGSGQAGTDACWIRIRIFGQDADGFAVDFFRGGVGAPVAPAWTDQCEARLRAAAKRALPDEPVYAWRDRPTEWGAQSHCQCVRPYLARRHRRRLPSPRLGR